MFLKFVPLIAATYAIKLTATEEHEFSLDSSLTLPLTIGVGELQFH